MINVGELIHDPDFCTSFKVIRSKGEWMAGDFTITQTTELNLEGIAQPADEEELETFPEGERLRGIMKFLADQEIYLSRDESASEEGRLSDEIHYHGRRYRVTRVKDWSEQGYWRAFGVMQDEIV